MAQDFNKLREVGRWLTVKLISELRQACHDIDCGIPVNNRELIFQAKINEIQSSQINLNILKEREDEYLKYIKYDFPTVISSSIPQLKQNIEFVSGDSIKGTAVDINSIKKYKSPRILITRDLSPSLTKYFNEINGIISLNGSMLSHLAIIAREKRIPIMITNDIKKYKIGEKVLMCHENQVGKSGISIK